MQHITGLVWQQLASAYPSHQTHFQTAFKHISDSYSGKERFYHNMQHLGLMLELQEAYKDMIDDHDSMAFAIFYHDIVYKADKTDNEEKSAMEAAIFLHQLTYGQAGISKVTSWINATKTHTNPTNNSDLNYLLDFDLSILSVPIMQYVEYARQIRQEYHMYPTLFYNPGRKKVLQHFLEMPYIYKTEVFRAMYEQTARENIKWEIGQL
jgi:predicted metal-dependent HD superfamily phosphohydrolase